MGCNCHNNRKQDKELIRKLAINFALANEEDIQIYTWTEGGAGRLYDFEPKGFTERGKGLVEVIEFRKHKSKNVLSDTKSVKRDSGKPKDVERTAGGSPDGADSKAGGEVGNNDESVRKVKRRKPTKKVEGDS